jgi:hypothetical protein
LRRLSRRDSSFAISPPVIRPPAASILSIAAPDLLRAIVRCEEKEVKKKGRPEAGRPSPLSMLP